MRTMTVASVALFVALGALFGFLGGLFGLGGAILAIPVLGIFFGMSEALSQGTAIVMALPNVAIGLYRYYKKTGLDLRVAGLLAAFALPFTFLAAHVATHLPSRPLRIGFAVFLLIVAADFARRTYGPPLKASIRLPLPWAGAVGAIGGTFSGLFAIGGAVVTVPAMTIFFGLSQLEAQGMSLAFSMPSSILTTATYAAANDVDWAVGLPLAIGGISAVSFGVDLAYRLPEKVLRTTFMGFIVVVACTLLWKGLAAGG